MTHSNPVLQAAEEFNAEIWREKQTEKVLQDVANERARQHEKWGEQNLPSDTGASGYRSAARRKKEENDEAQKEGKLTYRNILLEEVFEAFAESDPAKLRAELIQVAAVVVQWVEAIDRKAGDA